MGINKVQYGNTTLIDLTDTTATASDVAQGKYFYTNAGVKTAGTATGGGGGSVTQDQDGFIVLPPTGGGSSDNWSWMGKNPTKLSTIADEKNYLKDTGYATWTPSTTATKIVDATTTASNTLSLSYDYVILLKSHIHCEYASGTTENREKDHYYSAYVDLFSLSSTLGDLTANTHNTMTPGNVIGRNGMIYLDSNGTEYYGANLSYGVYTSAWSGIKNSSVSQGTITFGVSTPVISARCNSAYFTTTSASALDQDLSYFEYVIEIWRVDSNTTNSSAMTENIRDMWLNGF